MNSVHLALLGSPSHVRRSSLHLRPAAVSHAAPDHPRRHTHRPASWSQWPWPEHPAAQPARSARDARRAGLSASAATSPRGGSGAFTSSRSAGVQIDASSAGGIETCRARPT